MNDAVPWVGQELPLVNCQHDHLQILVFYDTLGKADGILGDTSSKIEVREGKILEIGKVCMRDIRGNLHIKDAQMRNIVKE